MNPLASYKLEAVLEARSNMGGAIAEATAQVETLEQRLERFDGNSYEANVGVNTRSFDKGLNDSLKAAKNFSKSIDREMQKTQKSISGYQNRLKRLAAFKPTVSIGADAEEFLRETNNAFREGKNFDRQLFRATLTADSRGVREAAAAARETLKSIQDERIEMVVAAETKKAVGELTRFQAFARSVGLMDIEVDVDVDTGKATPRLVGMAAAMTSAKIGVGALTSTMDRLDDAIMNVAVRMRALATVAIGGLILAIPALIGSIASLAGGLAILGSTAVGVGVGLGLVGGAALVLQKRMDNYSGAQAHLTRVQAKATKEMKKNGKVSKETAQDLAAAKKAVQDLGRGVAGLERATDSFKSTAAKAFEPAAISLARLAAKTINYSKQALPSLGRASRKTIMDLDGAFDTLDQNFRKNGVFASFRAFLRAAPLLTNNASVAFGNFGGGVVNVLRNALPFAQDFARWLRNISQRFLEWSGSQKGREQIQRWLKRSLPILKQVGKLVWDVTKAFISFGITNGPSIARGIRTLRDILDAVGVVLGPVFRGIFKLIDAFDQLSRGNLKGAAQSIRGVKDAITDLENELGRRNKIFAWLNKEAKESNKVFDNLGKTIRQTFLKELTQTLQAFAKDAGRIFSFLGRIIPGRLGEGFSEAGKKANKFAGRMNKVNKGIGKDTNKSMEAVKKGITEKTNIGYINGVKNAKQGEKGMGKANLAAAKDAKKHYSSYSKNVSKGTSEAEKKGTKNAWDLKQSSDKAGWGTAKDASKNFENVKKSVESKTSQAEKEGTKNFWDLTRSVGKAAQLLYGDTNKKFEIIKDVVVKKSWDTERGSTNAWDKLSGFVSGVLDRLGVGSSSSGPKDTGGDTNSAQGTKGGGTAMPSGGAFARGGLLKQGRQVYMMANGGIIPQDAIGGVVRGIQPHAVYGEAGDEAYIRLDKFTEESATALRTAQAEWGKRGWLDRMDRKSHGPKPRAEVSEKTMMRSPHLLGGAGLGPTTHNWRPDVAKYAEETRKHIGGISTNTYVGHPGGEQNSVDHWGPSGRGDHIAGSKGDAVESWVRSNYPVEYYIWKGKIHGWGKTRPYNDRSDQHFDHIHVTYGGGGKGVSDGGGSMGPVPNPLQALFEQLWRPIQGFADRIFGPMKEDPFWMQQAGGGLGSNSVTSIHDWIDGMIPDMIGGGGDLPGGKSPKGLTIGEALSQSGWPDNQLIKGSSTIWHESRGNAKAQNPSGARGLMQIMPGTARGVGASYDKLYDPLYNTATGLKVFKEAGGWGPWVGAGQGGDYRNKPVIGYADGGIPGRFGGKKVRFELPRGTRDAFHKVADSLRATADGDLGPSGGVTRGPTRLAGEDGQEAVVPLNRRTPSGMRALRTAVRRHGDGSSAGSFLHTLPGWASNRRGTNVAIDASVNGERYVMDDSAQTGRPSDSTQKVERAVRELQRDLQKLLSGELKTKGSQEDFERQLKLMAVAFARGLKTDTFVKEIDDIVGGGIERWLDDYAGKK